MSWPLVRITEVARVVGGATPKTDKNELWGGEIAWATPKDLSDLGQKSISQTGRYITSAGLKSCAAEVLPKGSVLFSSRAPIGHVAVNEVPMATNQGFKSFIPSERLDASFLYWWLDANRARLQAMGTGATFKEVSKAVVEKIEIPLPPLEEQKRVAGILDQADALRRMRARALEKLNTLGQAVFQEMFGDPATNPRSLPKVRIASAVSKISDGPFGSNLKSEHYTDAGVRVWRLQNITTRGVDDSDKAFISEAHYSTISKHTCLPGDVIVATLGDPNLRACIQPTTVPRAINKADCVQIRPNNDVAIADFWKGLINHPGMIVLTHSEIQGQTRARISMGRLREVFVPIPDIEEQYIYRDRVAAISILISKADAGVKELNALFASLQSDAFQGKL